MAEQALSRYFDLTKLEDLRGEIPDTDLQNPFPLTKKDLKLLRGHISTELTKGLTNPFGPIELTKSLLIPGSAAREIEKPEPIYVRGEGSAASGSKFEKPVGPRILDPMGNPYSGNIELKQDEHETLKQRWAAAWKEMSFSERRKIYPLSLLLPETRAALVRRYFEIRNPGAWRLQTTVFPVEPSASPMIKELFTRIGVGIDPGGALELKHFQPVTEPELILKDLALLTTLTQTTQILGRSSRKSLPQAHYHVHFSKAGEDLREYADGLSLLRLLQFMKAGFGDRIIGNTAIGSIRYDSTHPPVIMARRWDVSQIEHLAGSKFDEFEIKDRVISLDEEIGRVHAQLVMEPRERMRSLAAEIGATYDASQLPQLVRHSPLGTLKLVSLLESNRIPNSVGEDLRHGGLDGDLTNRLVALGDAGLRPALDVLKHFNKLDKAKQGHFSDNSWPTKPLLAELAHRLEISELPPFRSNAMFEGLGIEYLAELEKAFGVERASTWETVGIQKGIRRNARDTLRWLKFLRQIQRPETVAEGDFQSTRKRLDAQFLQTKLTPAQVTDVLVFSSLPEDINLWAKNPAVEHLCPPPDEVIRTGRFYGDILNWDAKFLMKLLEFQGPYLEEMRRGMLRDWAEFASKKTATDQAVSLLGRRYVVSSVFTTAEAISGFLERAQHPLSSALGDPEFQIQLWNKAHLYKDGDMVDDLVKINSLIPLLHWNGDIARRFVRASTDWFPNGSASSVFKKYFFSKGETEYEKRRNLVQLVMSDPEHAISEAFLRSPKALRPSGASAYLDFENLCDFAKRSEQDPVSFPGAKVLLSSLHATMGRRAAANEALIASTKNFPSGLGQTWSEIVRAADRYGQIDFLKRYLTDSAADLIIKKLFEQSKLSVGIAGVVKQLKYWEESATTTTPLDKNYPFLSREKDATRMFDAFARYLDKNKITLKDLLSRASFQYPAGQVLADLLPLAKHSNLLQKQIGVLAQDIPFQQFDSRGQWDVLMALHRVLSVRSEFREDGGALRSAFVGLVLSSPSKKGDDLSKKVRALARTMQFKDSSPVSTDSKPASCSKDLSALRSQGD